MSFGQLNAILQRIASVLVFGYNGKPYENGHLEPRVAFTNE